MKWPHTLIAGSALILLTNAVALGGAGYNRSGEAESQLAFTQRELNQSYSGSDNSGITLSLNWRIATKNGKYFDGRWETPVWLDKAKMVELGFDMDKFSAQSGSLQRGDAGAREVLLVLELNGQTYQQALQRAKENLEQTSPKGKKDAEENYQDELLRNSRLFVIDAGTDLSKLRTTYPDRGRYAIVHGLIHLYALGNISKLHAEFVNVPLRYRQVFEGGSPFDATVAFGKRLEPWIVAAMKTTVAKQTEEKH